MSIPGQNPSGKNPTTATRQPDWMDYLLQKLGVPDTNTNRAVLHYWTLSEDSTGGLNGGTNPLAICGASCPGVKGCVAQCDPGNCPISSYVSLQAGLDCTAMFILGQGTSARGNSGPLKGIMAGLFNGTDNADGTPDVKHMAITWQAINISGWCAGCQGGLYPNALYGALGKDANKILADVAGAVNPEVNAGAGVVSKAVGAAGSVVSDATKWASGLAKLLGTITSVAFWKRVGLGVLGVAFLVIGIVFILSETKVGQTVESAAVVAAAA